MKTRREYLKRASQFVVAVQLNLETNGFSYKKWGNIQTCKHGDWVVTNGRDTYTVDKESFARTYRQSSPGTYVKVTPVWAEVATERGEIRTKEGISHYRAGDYLVSNCQDGSDCYAVPKAEFERVYELSGEPSSRNSPIDRDALC